MCIVCVNSTLTYGANMKEVILYGGAFNPPTVAHQAILQACVEKAAERQAAVWVMPSGERADKRIGVSRDKRLRLAEALCASVVIRRGVSVRVETLELDQLQPTETFETNQRLCQKYTDTQFTWLFGSDSVETMPQWGGGGWLYKNLGMLVIPRPGYELATMPPRAKLLPVHAKRISSTEVRQLQEQKADISKLVPPLVMQLL